MKVDDALIGVTRLGLDSAPLIYFVEHNSAYAPIIREIMRRAMVGDFVIRSSVITQTEVLTLPRRLGNTNLEAAYQRLLLRGRNFSLVPIDSAVADQAATLRARYGLRTPDTLQLAAALTAGCEAFLSNDMGLRRVTELRVLVLDDLEL